MPPRLRSHNATYLPLIKPLRQSQPKASLAAWAHFFQTKERRNPALYRQRALARTQCITGCHYSTDVSITAVHAPHSIPTAFRQLDENLGTLEKEAGVYVNSSQLRLARRGLESSDAVTRIAVLGVGSQDVAARLTRILLADPLAPELEWERQLLQSGEKDRRAIVLKYGEKTRVEDHHPLVKTFSVPSSILHNHNLEILVHTIDYAGRAVGIQSLLVPSLDIPNSFGGRTSAVTYPVHKALVVAQDLERSPLIPIGEAGIENSMVLAVVNGPWQGLESSESETGSVKPINLELSQLAIAMIRASLERSVDFEHAWYGSGLPSIAQWLLADTKSPSEEDLKKSVSNLVQLISVDAVEGMRKEGLSQQNEIELRTISTATRDSLNRYVSAWAEGAHSELQNRLGGAFASTTWNKSRWWKLFWRIDEVAFIARDILQRSWLIDAEKEWIWLCGKVHQSGLLGSPESLPMPETKAVDNENALFRHPVHPKISDFLDERIPFRPEEGDPYKTEPWPPDIFLARSALIINTVPPLQLLSQKLLLQTLSITALTSSLSALLYISVSTTSIFEAGAVAALGLVYSLRRLQKRWESARSTWQEAVREKGKDVLRQTEGGIREAIKTGGRVEVDVADMQQRQAAGRAIAAVQESLEKVKGKRPTSN